MSHFGTKLTRPLVVYNAVELATTDTTVADRHEYVGRPDLNKLPDFAISKENIESITSYSVNEHLRPISGKEYEKLINILKTSFDPETNEPVYLFERGAIARVLFENYKKFAPDVSIDTIVNETINELVKLPYAFRDKHIAAWEKWKLPFKVAAESSKYRDLYSAEEKLDLAERGIAFKSLLEKKMTLPEPVVAPVIETIPLPSNVHPMLKLGLVRRR